MIFTPLIDHLIESLRVLPGVGAKSAQRMAFHLLERSRQGGTELAKALEQAMTEVRRCKDCWTFCESDVCKICHNPNREKQLLCVVESPADLLAVEQTAHYKGLYFVLMGRLSPISGVSPEDIGIPKLIQHVRGAGIKELILALSPTVEGEATSHYIAERVREMGILVTKIAQGVPLGEELEFVDSGTLAHALNGRRPV
ncbi:MAG: recombination protein RecR [Gammaproteobacteria bacterium]|nr:recombination protein RecR [Gammaproteobacteria bacterium]